MVDILRQAVADGFGERPLPPEQAKVLRAICQCRTAALGGHVHVCHSCGHTKISYNSCRNRHCPRCQGAAQHKWIAARMERTLDVRHFHVVFTLPKQLRPLALKNQRAIYGLLFKAASETLMQLGGDPKWLGAKLGVTMVLHTWTRELLLHPHVHCLVTAGGLDSDDHWRDSSPKYLFPVHVMGALFRGKFLDALRRLHRDDKLAVCELTEPTAFEALCRKLYDTKWVTYAKEPMHGAEHVLKYLGRYTHRVAISNSRILSADGDRVCFRTKGKKTKTLTVEQFTQRFLLHVLPKGFQKIRHYGLYASANAKTKWQTANALLLARAPRIQPADGPSTDSDPDDDKPLCCSACGSAHVTIHFYLPDELMFLLLGPRPPPDAAAPTEGHA